MSKKLITLCSFIVVALVAVSALYYVQPAYGGEKITGKTIVNGEEVESELIILTTREEQRQFYVERGLSQAEIDLAFDMDDKLEAAKQRKASRKELEKIFEEFNKQPREVAAERGEATTNESESSEQSTKTKSVRALDRKYILATCKNGPLATWSVGKRDYSSTFRTSNGVKYIKNYYCAAGRCDVTRSEDIPKTGWEYHEVLGLTPTNHKARCF